MAHKNKFELAATAKVITNVEEAFGKQVTVIDYEAFATELRHGPLVITDAEVVFGQPKFLKAANRWTTRNLGLPLSFKQVDVDRWVVTFKGE